MNEKLIMLPGTLCDDALFKHQIKDLLSTADCYVADTCSSASLKQVAKNILNTYSGDLYIMGLSYGGIIAFELLRQAPKRIKKLILLDTNHKKPTEETKINMQRFVGMAFLGDFEEITTSILTDAMLHPENAKNKELRNTVLDMAINVGVNGFFNQVKAQLARPDSTNDLHNIRCPTLIIAGKEDTVCPLELHEEMAATIPNSTLNIIKKCGHLSTLEQPDLVNKAIINWWSKN